MNFNEKKVGAVSLCGVQIYGIDGCHREIDINREKEPSPGWSLLGLALELNWNV